MEKRKRLIELRKGTQEKNVTPDTILSESDLEDTIHYIEAFQFLGTVRQNSYARKIAIDNLEIIGKLLKENKEIPKSAVFWIENKNNISEALLNVQQNL